LKKIILNAVKFLVFLSLGVALIWLVVKDLSEKDKVEIVRSISEANYAWIGLAMVVGIVAHISRAIRWKMLLAPLELKPKLSNTFYAVMIGYLGNLAINRLGEVLRCGILRRYEKIPFVQSFGTVITERIIDVILLLIVYILGAWLEYDRMKTYIADNITTPFGNKMHKLTANTTMFLLLLGIVAVVLILLFVFRKKIFQNPAVKKITTKAYSFWEGIRTVSKVKNPALFIFHSFFIWAMYLLSVYFCAFAFNETKTITIPDCLVIMAFGSLGVIATPGGIGAYQWIVLQILTFWGYSTAMGVAFGWVVWLAQTIVVLAVGLFSFGMLAINNKEKALS